MENIRTPRNLIPVIKAYFVCLSCMLCHRKSWHASRADMFKDAHKISAPQKFHE